MSDKATWLTMIERKKRRESNLSVLLKCALLVLIYYVLQIFNFSAMTFCFCMCLCVLLFFVNVLVDQKKEEYRMLYDWARKTPANDISFETEPHFNTEGRKAGKADFLTVCANWRLWVYYAFLFVVNLALLITSAVSR